MTPTPWKFEPQTDLDPDGNGYRWAVRVEGPHYYQNPAYVNTRPNAEFIVRACNAHTALVDALKGLLCHHHVAVNPSDTLMDRILAARAALKVAGVA